MVCLRRMDLCLTREVTTGKLFISVAELELIVIDSSGMDETKNQVVAFGVEFCGNQLCGETTCV